LYLVQALNRLHPSLIRTFEYLPIFKIFTDVQGRQCSELYPSGLVIAWKDNLTNLRVSDGGGQNPLWAEILWPNHLQRLSLSLCPAIEHPTLLDLSSVQDVLECSDQALQSLELDFCTSSHHLSEETRMTLAG
jgi:hypothetical protein